MKRPLHVIVLDQVRHPADGHNLFGMFDKKRDVVQVAKQDGIATLIKDTPFSELPLIEFYRSIVVHEIVHGAMYQNSYRSPISRAAFEYPAYAIQIQSLPPDTRANFLERYGTSRQTPFLFSDIILQADPYFFAARAYQHFSEAPNGCAALRSLLQGEVEFIATLQ